MWVKILIGIYQEKRNLLWVLLLKRDFVIQKADKGNVAAILNKKDYNLKM